MPTNNGHRDDYNSDLLCIHLGESTHTPTDPEHGAPSDPSRRPAVTKTSVLAPLALGRWRQRRRARGAGTWGRGRGALHAGFMAKTTLAVSVCRLLMFDGDTTATTTT